MKLSNIFKKTEAKNAKPKITKMDKNQLSKVIGGTGNSGREIKVETPASGGNY